MPVDRVKTELVLIIPHYNTPKSLMASIRSIRENIPIDLIIIDDGSLERLNEVEIKEIFQYGEVYFKHLNENKGIGIALNEGLELAKHLRYKYIARLDCGDFCKQDKFFKQITYLNQREDIKLLGTWARVIDDRGTFLYELRYPREHKEISKKMYLNNMFLHPSVIFRTEILDKIGNYPIKYRRASQDYAFFFKIVKNYKAENYPEILMDYVIEPHSISTTKRRLQVENRIRIVWDNFYIGYYPIYGLCRGLILYFLPRKATTYFKRLLSKSHR